MNKNIIEELLRVHGEDLATIKTLLNNHLEHHAKLEHRLMWIGAILVPTFTAVGLKLIDLFGHSWMKWW